MMNKFAPQLALMAAMVVIATFLLVVLRASRKRHEKEGRNRQLLMPVGKIERISQKLRRYYFFSFSYTSICIVGFIDFAINSNHAPLFRSHWLALFPLLFALTFIGSTYVIGEYADVTKGRNADDMSLKDHVTFCPARIKIAFAIYLPLLISAMVGIHLNVIQDARPEPKQANDMQAFILFSAFAMMSLVGTSSSATKAMERLRTSRMGATNEASSIRKGSEG